MTRFEELQEIWQSQPQDAAVTLDIRGTTDTLRRFGRRQNLINGGKAIFIFAQLCFCFYRLGVSLTTVIGEGLFVAGLANLLLADWRAQISIAQLDFTSPSVSFIEDALERMRDPNAAYRKRLGLNLLLVCIGYNILEISRLTAATFWRGLLVQGGVTALLVVLVFTVGLTFHAKRCEMEYRPIKARLTAMRQALEDQQQ